MSKTNKKILLIARPGEGPVPKSVFKTVEEEIPKPKDGEIVVRNLYLSLDPAMRGWMKEGRSYIPPVALGDVMRGGTVGEVVASKNSKYNVGDYVSLIGNWQDYAVSNGSGVSLLPPGFGLTPWLGVLGMPGFTAYFGLLDVGMPKAGETVLVSGAAGAVGSIVGQIAKLKGCRVVGIAGSDDKCEWLVKDLGFDAAINYKTSKNIFEELKKTCPKGVDVYFDNVGGELLDVVLRKINMKARIVICGAISQYNSTQTRGPANYMMLLVNRARMEGFVVFDYAKRYPEAIREMGAWLKEGKLKHHEHVVQGLENAPEALNLLFSGKNNGKLIVQIGQPKQSKY